MSYSVHNASYLVQSVSCSVEHVSCSVESVSCSVESVLCLVKCVVYSSINISVLCFSPYRIHCDFKIPCGKFF